MSLDADATWATSEAFKDPSTLSIETSAGSDFVMITEGESCDNPTEGMTAPTVFGESDISSGEDFDAGLAGASDEDFDVGSDSASDEDFDTGSDVASDEDFDAESDGASDEDFDAGSDGASDEDFDAGSVGASDEDFDNESGKAPDETIVVEAFTSMLALRFPTGGC